MHNEGLISFLMGLPIFEAEWVLWSLIVLSLVSVAAMIECLYFYMTHKVDIEVVRGEMAKLLDKGDYAGAARYLAEYDTMETNVVLFGLREHAKGPESVEDLLSGAVSREKMRYERFLTFLGTVGSNAPFIGLFGTVLGIIKAFADLAGNIAEASSSVMAGISEALIATAVGLLVAIPAVIAYNALQRKVRRLMSEAEGLVNVMLATLTDNDALAGNGDPEGSD